MTFLIYVVIMKHPRALSMLVGMYAFGTTDTIYIVFSFPDGASQTGFQWIHDIRQLDVRHDLAIWFMYLSLTVYGSAFHVIYSSSTSGTYYY